MLIDIPRDEVAAIIERVVLEQLKEFWKELPVGQMKVIAEQVARESARRLADPNT